MKIIALFLSLLLAAPAGASWYTFNGTTSAVYVFDTDIRLTEFTFCAWTRRTGDGEGGQGAIAHASTTGFWDFNHSGATYEFDEASMVGRWTVPEPLVNIPIHVCVAYNGGSPSNNPTIWFNGVDQTETEAASPSGTFSVPQEWVWGNNYNFSHTWDGQVGEAAIWGRTLALNEVKQTMAYGPQFVSGGRPISYLPMGDFGVVEWGTATITWSTNGTLTAVNTGPPRSSPQGGLIWLGQ